MEDMQQELEVLRTLNGAVSDWALARTDPGFQRRVGIKRCARDIEDAAALVVAFYEERES
jgi:hypothetical protein